MAAPRKYPAELRERATRMAVEARQDPATRAGARGSSSSWTSIPRLGLIHHSDRGVRHLAVRYTQRLAEAGAGASVGSRDDSYDTALAGAFNSLFTAELVPNKGPWKRFDRLEIAVAEYIDWFNRRRLHGETHPWRTRWKADVRRGPLHVALRGSLHRTADGSGCGS